MDEDIELDLMVRKVKPFVRDDPQKDVGDEEGSDGVEEDAPDGGSDDGLEQEENGGPDSEPDSDSDSGSDYDVRKDFKDRKAPDDQDEPSSKKGRRVVILFSGVDGDKDRYISRFLVAVFKVWRNVVLGLMRFIRVRFDKG